MRNLKKLLMAVVIVGCLGWTVLQSKERPSVPQTTQKVSQSNPQNEMRGMWLASSSFGKEKDWRYFTSGKPTEEEKADKSRVEEYHHGLRTGLFLMDGTRPRLLMELLSASDCSYTGVVEYGDEF